jgi:hypothetical protein
MSKASWPENEDGELQSFPVLNEGEIHDLIERDVFSGGMIPRSWAASTPSERCRPGPIIDGRIPHCLCSKIFTNKGIGTMIPSNETVLQWWKKSDPRIKIGPSTATDIYIGKGTL